MKDIVADSKLVAYCGLYCGACRRYLTDSCPGCRENEKAAWCKVRACCIDDGYATCAECTTYTNPMDCRKFNNFISKVIGFLLRSDRGACIEQIRRRGLAFHAEDMTKNRRQTMPRR